METKIYKLIQNNNRKSALSHGFYDGRFKPKIVPDKKKIVYIKMRKNKNIDVEL